MNGDPTIPHPDPPQPPSQPDPPGTPVPGPPGPGTPPEPVDPPLHDPVPDPQPVRDPPRQPAQAQQTVASERGAVSALLEGWSRALLRGTCARRLAHVCKLAHDSFAPLPSWMAGRVEPYAPILNA